MVKVKYGTIDSARVKIDNSVDTQRVYDMKGIACIQKGILANVENGEVFSENVRKATFSQWGENLSISYHGVAQPEMDTICRQIVDFIAEAKVNVPPVFVAVNTTKGGGE